MSAAIRHAQRHIIELVSRRPRTYEWQVHTLVTQMLGLLLQARGVLSEPKRAVPRAVARVVDTVAADPTRNWKARELAGHAGVSYSSLRMLFRQAHGETLKAFLQRTRLDQARLLLGDPRLSIKDVALRLQCSSEHYFSHFFRAATGMSPSQYRLLANPPRG